LAAYDNFDDRYLGAKSSNPTVDNDGNTLLAGALYFNTVVPEMRLWTGSAWVAAYVSGTGFLASANNLSELTATASTARTNLGLGTAAVVADSTLVHTSGNETIAGTKTFSSDASISGLTVGKGGSAVVTNTAVGGNALNANTTGNTNTAIGFNSLTLNTTGTENTGIGTGALETNTTGAQNTGIGREALDKNTTANGNTAVGYRASYSNTTGTQNASVGQQSLNGNTTGSSNSALGYQALLSNTTGGNNTAVGYQAGYSNTTGTTNAFFGYQAGYNNIAGIGNTFIGMQAGSSHNTAGNTFNTFVGYYSGYSTTGTLNSFFGEESGNAITTGSKNTILGRYSGNQGGLDIRTASNYIVLSDGDGNPRGAFDSNGVLRLGDVGVAPSYGTTKLQVYRTGSSVRLVEFNNANNANNDENLRLVLGVNANNTSSYALILTTGGADKYYLYGNGTYGTISDRTLKKNIETTRNGYIDDLCKLRVVKYNWTTDEEGTPKELGWIAQEVEEVFPNLVQDGKPNDQGEVHKQVKTSVLPFMLLKAIQELKTIVDAQAAEIAELKAKVA
jgi:hypothetical protein